MSGTHEPGDLNDPHLRDFTLAAAVSMGSLVGLWLGWPFVIGMALITIWHLGRYLAANWG